MVHEIFRKRWWIIHWIVLFFGRIKAMGLRKIWSFLWAYHRKMKVWSLFLAIRSMSNLRLLMVQKSQRTTWDVHDLAVNNGINCQPQLVSRISEPSTVVHSCCLCFKVLLMDLLLDKSPTICETRIHSCWFSEVRRPWKQCAKVVAWASGSLIFDWNIKDAPGRYHEQGWKLLRC